MVAVLLMAVVVGYVTTNARRRWQAVAKRHPGVPLDDADGYIMENGVSVNGSGNFMAHVRVGAHAFSMVPTLPAAFFHDVMVIPWDAVAHVTRHKSFLDDAVVVTLADDAGELVFRSRVGAALVAAFERFQASESLAGGSP